MRGLGPQPQAIVESPLARPRRLLPGEPQVGQRTDSRAQPRPHVLRPAGISDSGDEATGRPRLDMRALAEALASGGHGARSSSGSGGSDNGAGVARGVGGSSIADGGERADLQRRLYLAYLPYPLTGLLLDRVA